LRRVTERMSEAYARQGEPDYERKPVDCIDHEFVDYFGAVGPIEHVIAKLKPMTDLGLGHIYFINGGGGEIQSESRARLAEVAGALRA